MLTLCCLLYKSKVGLRPLASIGTVRATEPLRLLYYSGHHSHADGSDYDLDQRLSFLCLQWHQLLCQLEVQSFLPPLVSACFSLGDV